MQLDEYITATEIAFEKLMTPTKGLTADAMEIPMADGKWSFKEMAAHFTYWNTAVIRRLEAMHHDREFDVAPYMKDFDVHNRTAIDGVKDVPVKRVMTELRITHSALMETVKRVTPEKLCPDGEVPKWLPEWVTDHYDHHRPQVEAWVERLKVFKQGSITNLPVK